MDHVNPIEVIDLESDELGEFDALAVCQGGLQNIRDRLDEVIQSQNLDELEVIASDFKKIKETKVDTEWESSYIRRSPNLWSSLALLIFAPFHVPRGHG